MTTAKTVALRAAAAALHAQANQLQATADWFANKPVRSEYEQQTVAVSREEARRLRKAQDVIEGLIDETIAGEKA